MSKANWLDEPVTLDEIYGTISDREILFWKIFPVACVVVLGGMMCLRSL